MSRSPVIGFAGLTHLGINTALASAARGFKVIGFHEDEALVNELRQGGLPIEEPGLPELLEAHRERITFSADPEALAVCDLVYIAVDVPTNDRGESDLGPIREIIGTATGAMNSSAVLVVLCQVPPGFTRALPHDHRRLFYQVETLIFGRAVERAMNPERFIVGCAEPGLPLPESLTAYLGAFGCPILPMRYESAELAKISINMCLVASVSVANLMAEICERIGADWSEVIPSLRLDRRIGPYSYINPGLGISGGNLERDLATVLRICEPHAINAGMVSEWITLSRHRKEWPFETLKRLLLDSTPDASVAVLGLAYKENTHSIKNSPALVLIERLSSCRVTVYDPVVPALSAGSSVVGASSALDAVSGADAVVIMTAWPEFKEIVPRELQSRMRGRLVIDPYRMLDAAQVKAAGLDYATLGLPAAVTGGRPDIPPKRANHA